MRKVASCAGLVLIFAVSALAQKVPEAELAFGYSYVRASSGGTSTNLHGASGSIAGNLTSWLGIVGDIGAYKATDLPSGVSGNALTYLFGPRISYRNHDRLTPFGQILLGGTRVRVSGGSIGGAGSLGGISGSGSRNAFSVAVGGGLDVKLTESVAVRLVQAEYLMTRFNSQTQNNARISAGLVLRFGHK